MENKEQQVPVQDEQLFEDIGIEQAKELFEYEMTSVLLGFKNEIKSMKRRDVSEYLDMEVPDASVDYKAPDIQLKGIEYSDDEVKVSLEDKKTVVDLSGLTIENIPDIKEINVGSINVYTEIKTVQNIHAAETQSFEFSLVSANELPASLISPVSEAVPVSLPCISTADVFNTPDLSSLTFQSEPVHISDPVRSGSVSISGISLPDFNAGKVEIADLSVNDLVSMPEISVPAVDAADVNIPVLSSEAFSVKVPEMLSVPDYTGRFEVPVFPEFKPCQADYPEIPDKPDISKYYTDLLESLKSEI